MWCYHGAKLRSCQIQFLSELIGHRCNGGMGSETWNNVRGWPHQSDQSAHVNLAIFSINTNLRQAVVPCWGTVHFWTSSCSLRTHQCCWEWLLGPDLWPDRSLSWSAGWEKKASRKVHVSLPQTDVCIQPSLQFSCGIPWMFDHIHGFYLLRRC